MNPSEFSENLVAAMSNVLLEMREQSGLSANELAKRAGLNRQAITFIERGERTPQIDTLCRIAFALDSTPSEIWKKVESEANNSSTS